MDENENKKHFGSGFLGAFATDQQFHDYILREYCGCGAYGEVWQAEDISGRRLAIKIVSKKIYGTGWQREFNGIKNYCRTISSHQNLIQIMHVGEDEQYFFYTMELADNLAEPGKPYYADTLADRLAANGPFASDQLVILIQHLLNGTGALHEAGLIHRDIKPANIIFINGVPKLSDIGFVAQRDASMSLAGTVGFIPPEELLGENGSSADKNCQYDIYALGKVMYCALTGLPPDEFPLLPESISFGLSKRLNQVICMACCKNPAERIGSIDEFRQLLMAAANGEEKLERQKNSKPAAGLPQTPMAKKMAAAAIIVIVIIILGGLFVLGGLFMLKDRIQKNVTIMVSGGGKANHPAAANTAAPSTQKPANSVNQTVQEQRIADGDTIPSDPPIQQPVKNYNWTVPELNMQLIYVEPGTFMMGEGKSKHRVSISRNSWIGKYEVTQQEYQKLMGGNPSVSKGDKLPVEYISWNDAADFCAKLTERERKAGRLPESCVYRLPTQAEWEYAVRGGNKSKNYLYSGDNNIDIVSWNKNNAGGTTHEVGTKPPNELGIYDMSGNVWELCLDWYGAYSTAEAVDPVNVVPGKNRVMCGGGYTNNSFPGARSYTAPENKHPAIGFRVALAAFIPGATAATPVENKAVELKAASLNVKTIASEDKNPNSTVPELNMQMVYVEPGMFMMGEGKSKHRVTISRGLWIGKYEVTQQEYEKIMGSNPSQRNGKMLPVECASWSESVNFCEKLTELAQRAGKLPDGYVYRLPTAAEWEYAARGGNKSKGYEYCGGNDIDIVAWHKSNAGETTHEVGTKLPNELGIYDMAGNVWELCLDWYGPYSTVAAVDPVNIVPGKIRVACGGGYLNSKPPGYHGSAAPERKSPEIGFRVVLAAPVPGTVFATAPAWNKAVEFKAQNTPVPQPVKQVAGPVKNVNWSVPELGLELLYIRPGSFIMGSTQAEREWAVGPEGKTNAQRLKLESGEPDENAIQDAFWIGRTKVTVGQWRKFIDATGYRTDAEKRGVAYCFDWQKHNKWMWMPEKSWRDPNYSYPLQDNFPVTCVSWNDAVAFCQWLTESERRADRMPQELEYRLPAEAEWEYACRGGRAETRFWWGNDWSDAAGRLNAAGSDKFPNGKSFQANCGKEDRWTFVSPVDFYGEKGCNGFALADMLGNAWEWCQDEADDNSNPAAMVLRGGAFDAPPGNLRCAGSICDNRSEPCAKYGFRIVCGTVEEPEESVSTVSTAKTAVQFPVWFYNGHYYRLFNEYVSWNVAKKRCEEMGGYLAGSETPGENSFLYEKVSQIDGVIFIGATDQEKAGDWRWAGSGKRLKFSRWDSGQPVSDGNNKDYAAFSPVARKDRWGSYDGMVCNNKTPGENTYGFICEWEKPEPANKSLTAKPAEQDENKKDSAVMPANSIIIKISTPRKKTAYTKHLTLYAMINKSNPKYILCQDKSISRGSSHSFVLQCPKDITEIGTITLEAETGDCWAPSSFTFELPDNKVWTFTGQVSLASSKDKILQHNAQPSITFNFTGLKAGAIQTRNSYIDKVPDWAPLVKGICTVKVPSIQQQAPAAPIAPPPTVTPAAAQSDSNDLFMRGDRKKRFLARYEQDRKRYNESELNEIEGLYQAASKKFNSPEAMDGFKKLISKYPQANRTGCAMLYLGQTCPDRPQAEDYLRRAIADYGDCWYGDGVQVGAYARFYLAGYCRQSGKIQEAEKLYQEIRDKYPGAVAHNGKLLASELPK
jgi:formylglycine-generating enzyme required for sulfatase activity/serine/threonine protein kinase/TolA-binding protein